MNRKIPIQLVAGIILILAISIGLIFWLQNKKESQLSVARQAAVNQNTTRPSNVQTPQAPFETNMVQNEDTADSGKRSDSVLSVNGEAKDLSFIIKDESCGPGYPSSKLDVLKGGKKINDLVVVMCDLYAVDMVARDNNYTYFSLKQGGFGGYILYGLYNNLFRISSKDNTIENIISGNLSDYAIDRSLSKLVYTSNGKVIIKNLKNKIDKDYGKPTNEREGEMQIGDFLFSPKEDKIAIAVGYGPLDESGAIYTLDLDKNKFELYKKTEFPPSIKKWTEKEGIVWE